MEKKCVSEAAANFFSLSSDFFHVFCFVTSSGNILAEEFFVLCRSTQNI
jgi:hypothetical protein